MMEERGEAGGEEPEARGDHMLQFSSSTLFMNLCPDEAPEGSAFKSS